MKRFSELSILVVENNDHMRAILREVLSAFGVGEVIEAEDALTAYLMMCCERVDLVILDYFLRERTGGDFIRLLRHDAACPNRTTPVVVLTALPAHARAEGVFAAGAQSVLAKPITPRRLYEEMVAVLSAGAIGNDWLKHGDIAVRGSQRPAPVRRIPAQH